MNDVKQNVTSSAQKVTLGDSDVSKLEAETQDIKTMVCNLEKAVSLLAEQVHLSYKEMTDQIELIAQARKNSFSNTTLRDTSLATNSVSRNRPEKNTSQGKPTTPTDTSKAGSLSEEKTAGASLNSSQIPTKTPKLNAVRSKKKRNASKKDLHAKSDPTDDKQNVVIKNSTTKSPVIQHTMGTPDKTNIICNIVSDNEAKNDETKSSTDDESDTSSSNEDDVDNDATGNSSTLPYVMIFHDSTLNGIDARRLGNSYGLSVRKKNMHTLDDFEKELDNMKAVPDAIVVHCGINNLKQETAETACMKMVNVVNKITEEFRQTKIIVSHVIPTGEGELEVKRKLFNALVFGSLFQEENITFIEHNLRPYNKTLFRDTIHPSERGSSVLASNIGRHLGAQFWQYRNKQRPRPKSGKSSFRQRTNAETTQTQPCFHAQQQEKQTQSEDHSSRRPDTTCDEIQDRSEYRKTWKYGNQSDTRDIRRDSVYRPYRQTSTQGGKVTYENQSYQTGDRRNWRYYENRYGQSRHAWNNNWRDRYYWIDESRRNRQDWRYNEGGDGHESSGRRRYDVPQNGYRDEYDWRYDQYGDGRKDSLHRSHYQLYGERRRGQDWRSYRWHEKQS